MADLSPTELDGTAFVTTGTEGRDLVEGSTLRIAFEDGRLAAQAGCNTMSAPYAVSDGRLAWSGPPMSTRMACPEDLMAQDTWLSALLQDGAEATLDADTLTLVAGDVTLRLARE